MKCLNCGAEINDFSAFCTYCGKPTGSGTPAEEADKPVETAPPPGYSDPILMEGRMPDPRPTFDSLPEFNRTETGYIPEFTEDVKMNGTSWAEINRMGYIVGENGQHYGIEWLRFILFVQLFAAALFSLISAVQFFRGADSFTYASESTIFPMLQTLDMVMGSIDLLTAAAMIVTRFMLSGLRKLGIWMYLGMHLFNLILAMIYYSIFCSITGVAVGDILDFPAILQLIVNAAMIGINYVYLRNRRCVFVN